MNKSNKQSPRDSSSEDSEYSEENESSSFDSSDEESSNSDSLDSPKTPKSPNFPKTNQKELETVHESNRVLSTGILELQNTLKLKNERIKALEIELEELRLEFNEQKTVLKEYNDQREQVRQLEIKLQNIRGKSSLTSQLCIFTFVGVLCFAVGLVFSYHNTA